VPGGIGKMKSGQFIAALAGFLERISLKFEVIVYSLSYTVPEKNLIGSNTLNIRIVNARHTESLMKRMLLLIAMLLKDHRLERYHLIHGIWGFPAGFIAVLLGKLLRLPNVVSLMGGEAACVPQIAYGNMYHWRLKKITLWTCRHASELTALTHYQWQELRRFAFKRERVHIIPYGVNKALFKPVKRSFSPPFHFIHVANLNEVKDQKTLLRAFVVINKHFDCRLRIIGPDYLDGQLQRFAQELKIANRIEFTGYLPYDQLPAHYQWAHVMLHTSYYEGQGFVIAEAAASGVVICGTRVGLIADLGEDCAVTIDIGDDKTLAAKVIEILNHPGRYEKLRRNALEWSSIYDINWTTTQYQQLYDKLIH
jgi:glycosyltransferase involved in cell wall biosynthesis